MYVNSLNELPTKPNTKAFAFLRVCLMADGAPLGIPVHVIRGAKPGPKLVVMSTAHGYETCQISIIRELLETIDPAELSGTLVCVPIANPIAFEMGARNTWVDGLWGDNGNMNRLWPGRANGWLTERMTHAISQEVFPNSDCVIDLHSASKHALELSYGYLGKASQKELGISLAFGQDVLVDVQDYEVKEKGQGATSTAYLRGIGIPTYSTEIGTFPGIAEERARMPEKDLVRRVPEVGVTGVTNVMKHLHMIAGDLVLPERQLIVQPELNLRPNNGGLLVSHVTAQDLGSVVRKGTVLGTVISPYTFEELEEIVAPFEDSLLLAAITEEPFRKVNAGDYAFIVSDHSKSRWIEAASTDGRGH